MNKPAELAFLLLFGAMFGLLLGIGLNPDLRRYTLGALCLFISAACLYYIISSRKR